VNGTEVAADTGLKKWVCVICGFIYDEALGLPDYGIPPGTRFADLPEDWVCPECGSAKSAYEEFKE
jgi:rubredoxin